MPGKFCTTFIFGKLELLVTDKFILLTTVLSQQYQHIIDRLDWLPLLLYIDEAMDYRTKNK